ncbi:hypothetical protein V6N13_114624 [Hibiscus sabdariffa]
MLHKQQANWSPHDNNEGYCVAVADTNYCVFAVETQMLTDVKKEPVKANEQEEDEGVVASEYGLTVVVFFGISVLGAD